MAAFGINAGLDFDTAWRWLLVYGIALARPMAMLSIHPVFNRVPLTGVIRGAVASALAIPMIPVVATALPDNGLAPIALLLLTLKEAVIGSALGLLLAAPFWALDVTGDLMDAQRGATQGRLNDPAGFEDVSISGTLLVMTGVVLFAMTGGLETLTGLLYDSWNLWRPLGGLPQLNDRTPLLLLGMLDSVTRQGLLVASPAVFSMLLADAALLVFARNRPTNAYRRFGAFGAKCRVPDLHAALRVVSPDLHPPGSCRRSAPVQSDRCFSRKTGRSATVSGSDTSEERTLPPSAKKLRDAREKGQIAQSRELVAAAVTATAFGYLSVRFLPLFARLSDSLRAVPGLYDQPFATAAAILASRLARDLALAVTPLLGLLVAIAILSNIAVNGGLFVAIDPVVPKMERLDPVAGFKRMFGMATLMELLKSIFKVAAIAILTCIIIGGALQALVEIPACGLRCAAPVFEKLLSPLIFASVGLFLLLGGFDIGLQRWLFYRQMRMTKTEQKRERKESDGDPMIRRQRLQDRRKSFGSKTGLRNATFLIRSADTVLAMRYAAPDATVPILVARGTRENASKLLNEAKTLNLPVVFDAAAVALVAPRLKVGRMVTPDIFEPVIACMHQAGIL